MPVITAVEPQKKNPQRFNIFIDGEFAFGADEDLVVNYRLVIGKVISLEILNKLLFESEVGKLMERMYRLFSVRQRSEKEVRDYLKNLSYKRKLKGKEELSQVAIDLSVERLKQKGLIADEDFARAWVAARRKSKQKGKAALKAELYQKGIDREVVEEVLSDDGETEEVLARQALEKKMKIWANLPPLEFKKKATEFLLRRGFEYGVVRTVIEKLVKK